MNKVTHEDVEIRKGDAFQIAFPIKDRNGNAVALAGATATYRVAKKGSLPGALFEKTETSGIVLSGSTATVSIDEGDFEIEGVYIGQLRITKSGAPMVAAEGEIRVKPLIE